MSTSLYVGVPLMALLAVLQTAVFSRFPILGVVPQLPFLVALSWGILRGIDEGAQWAFVAGFFLDLFSTIPMGITSLCYVIAIVVLLWVSESIPVNRFFLPAVLSFLASMVYLGLYVVVVRLLSDRFADLEAVGVLLPLILVHAVLILPVYWVSERLLRFFRPRRVQI